MIKKYEYNYVVFNENVSKRLTTSESLMEFFVQGKTLTCTYTLLSRPLEENYF